MTMDQREMTLSFSSIWNGLSTPVLVLAEELALRRAAHERPATELRIGAGGIEVVRGSGLSREPLLAAPGRPQAAIKEVVQRMAGGLGPEVAVTFAADQSVSQQLVLPQQPDDVLQAIVRNKVESLAPWPLAQCLWGMRRSLIAGDPQHVAVDVAVVSRAQLDEIGATLRQAGSEVKALSVALPDGEELDIALGAGDERRAAREAAVRKARTAAIVAGLLVVLGVLWVYRISAEASHLEEDTAALMSTLTPNGVPAGETPLVSAANRLFQARRERLPAVAVIDEVSKLLPDTVYLVTLSLDGDQLTIKGQGSGVPDLVQILEASPDFQSVNFAAATELDQNSNADAFSLIAVLEKAAPEHSAPAETTP